MSPRFFPAPTTIDDGDEDIGINASSSPAMAHASPLQHPTIVHVNGSKTLNDDNVTEMDVDVDEGDEYSDSSAATEEVDELESDHEEPQAQWHRAPPGGNADRVAGAGTSSGAAQHVAPTKTTPIVKKPRPKPPTTRLPGQTIVPMSRVEAIIATEVGQNGVFQREASFLISLATEEFTRRLTRVANSRSRLDKRSLTTYNDIADSAHYFEEYNFLQEMIPRPMTPRSALAERKRILEEQEALLHGVGVEGADSAYVTKSKLGQISASASTSMASTPVPRLTKSTPAPNAGANGKPPSKVTKGSSAAKRSSPDIVPVVRSERQKQKRARLSQSAGSEPTVSGHMPPPPSPAERGNKQDGTIVNGTGTAHGSGMKIKIRPRLASASGSAPPNNSPTPPPPPVLPLGPPPSSIQSQTSSSSTHPKGRESGRRSSRAHASRKQKEANASLVFEQAEKSGGKDVVPNGKPVQFAPVGVDASDQPLYTRAPLPPRHVVIRPKAVEERSVSPTNGRINEDSDKVNARRDLDSKNNTTAVNERIPRDWDHDAGKDTGSEEDEHDGEHEMKQSRRPVMRYLREDNEETWDLLRREWEENEKAKKGPKKEDFLRKTVRSKI